MFKLGDHVYKKKPYNDIRYCCYGGEAVAVPLGTEGTITRIQSDIHISVLFDNGRRWGVHPDELDYVKNKYKQSEIDVNELSLGSKEEE